MCEEQHPKDTPQAVKALEQYNFDSVQNADQGLPKKNFISI